MKASPKRVILVTPSTPGEGPIYRIAITMAVWHDQNDQPGLETNSLPELSQLMVRDPRVHLFRDDGSPPGCVHIDTELQSLVRLQPTHEIGSLDGVNGKAGDGRWVTGRFCFLARTVGNADIHPKSVVSAQLSAFGFIRLNFINASKFEAVLRDA